MRSGRNRRQWREDERASTGDYASCRGRGITSRGGFPPILYYYRKGSALGIVFLAGAPLPVPAAESAP